MDDERDYHECDFCRTMIVNPSRAHPPSKEEVPDNIIFFEPQIEALLSSTSICKLSRWLVRAWTAHFSPDWEELKSRSQEITICVFWLSYNFDGFPIAEFNSFGLWDEREPFVTNRGHCRIRTGGDWDVVAAADSPAAKFVSTRPINREIGSPENYILGRRWIAECLNQHEMCPGLQETFIPRIVLKLKKTSHDQYQVALHFPKSPEPYTALSYCWGGDQPHKTTKSRINSGNLTLNWSELPRSIQDAVKVTVGLGYTYLWIDSLCIVQDDNTDKAEQIGLMPQIYSNAVVTIIASRSEKAADGFLHDIDVRSNTSIAVKLPFECPDSSGRTAILITRMKYSGDPEPIEYRGWTLQERYLSPRVLEYTSNQLIWGCNVNPHDEGYTDGWKSGGRYDNSDLNFPNNFYREQSISKTPNGNHDAVNEWRSVLGVYTKRSLTLAEDRILAISGVAERFSTLISDQYFAGHWKETLPYDLLWCIFPGTILQPRPTKYQAPSWSWAAVQGRIWFRYASSTNPSHWKPPEPVMSISEICTDLSENVAPYGAVTRGSIKGYGKIQLAAWFGNQESVDHFHTLHTPGSDETSQPIPLLRMLPDAREPEFERNPSDRSASIRVYLLHVGTCTRWGPKNLTGLVLRDVPTDSQIPAKRRFTRLGIFWMNCANTKNKGFLGSPRPSDALIGGDNSTFFDDCRMQEFEII